MRRSSPRSRPRAPSPTTTRSAAASSAGPGSRSPARPSPKPTAYSSLAHRSPTTRRSLHGSRPSRSTSTVILGKFHPVEVPLWGDIARTIDGCWPPFLPSTDLPSARRSPTRWQRWRSEKTSRRDLVDANGRLHPAPVFDVLSELMPDDAVDRRRRRQQHVQLRHFFECRGRQDVLMSGYLGSIGFASPPRSGLQWRCGARVSARKVVSISAMAASASTSPRSRPP